MSLLLNGSDIAARIPQETRTRVQNVIRETGYLANPMARRMAKGLKRILGVFTCEPAFPIAHADLFTPFLFGIEEVAQACNYDLLLLTGNAGAEKRKLFADGNRLHIADGCIVLGKACGRTELERLALGDFPLVAIGRRNDAGGPVPYVGGDVASCKVLAHKVAITLEACHAMEVIEQAFAQHGTPEIVNTDQGSQFTATEFTDVVLTKGCKLSMDGRGDWRDNVFVERFWRSVKYERVYLRAYDSVSAARTDIATYIDGFNKERPHSNLEDATPDKFYQANLARMKAVA